MKFSLIFLLLTLLSSTNAQTSVNKIITIDPYMSFENYEHFKRLTLSSPDSNIEFLDGFDFEWGYRYTVSVKETRLRETLSDGTQYRYQFNRIVSKTKMADSSQFDLYIDAKRYYYEVEESEASANVTLRPIDDHTFLYFDEVEIEVPDHLKDAFGQIVAGDKSTVGTFKYINEKRIQLVHL